MPKINTFTTNDYSNCIMYLTTKIVPDAKILSVSQSFKINHMTSELTNKDTFLCLIDEANVTYLSSNSAPVVLLPFIISFINEGSLINTCNYIEYPSTFIQPIRNYLLIDSLPMYTMYENFYCSLNNDLVTLGYSSEEIKLIHYEVGRTIGTLSFEHKGKTYSEDKAVELFIQA